MTPLWLAKLNANEALGNLKPLLPAMSILWLVAGISVLFLDRLSMLGFSQSEIQSVEESITDYFALRSKVKNVQMMRVNRFALAGKLEIDVEGTTISRKCTAQPLGHANTFTWACEW